MSLKDWKYYNHAIIPAVEPHEKPDLSCIKDRTIWKVGGIPFLARWTTDYDCGCETSWWYVIKDTPFNIATLKAKRRYEINKGKKNFEVRRINPSEYVEELYYVQTYAFESWPEKYRPVIQKETFEKDVAKWNSEMVYGGFNK